MSTRLSLMTTTLHTHGGFGRSVAHIRTTFVQAQEEFRNNNLINQTLINETDLRSPDRQTDRYFIDRKKVITDFFVIAMREIYVHVYKRLLICYHRRHQGVIIQHPLCFYCVE